MLRLNVAKKRNVAVDSVSNLDAFPKINEDYKKKTSMGGGFSLCVCAALCILIYSEIQYYRDLDLEYSYRVDNDHESKLKVNVDITVAMKCTLLGADILDQTGKGSQESSGDLAYESTTFALTPEQSVYFDSLHAMNKFLKSEYHALHRVLWKSGYRGFTYPMASAPAETNTSKHDACRIHGSMEMNKIAGNFHITVGKKIEMPFGGHAHFAGNVDFTEYNFSHRITHFSYGDPAMGVLNSLDGSLKITEDNNYMYQYFVQIVPTEIDSVMNKLKTYQYSVTESNRTISHSSGSHGMPGIFFKYDISPILIRVGEQSYSLSQFVVRLCGIVGGVFVTAGWLNTLLQYAYDSAFCSQASEGSVEPATPITTPLTDPLTTPLVTPLTTPLETSTIHLLSN